MDHSNDRSKPLWRVIAEERALLGLPLPWATPPVGTDEDLLKQLYGQIHQDSAANKGRAALCFSGGGIRSASFNLGVLQQIVRLGLLDEFDYLSTVSGGGYLGSWLSAWISRHPDGKAGVATALKPPPPGTTPVDPLNPEPAPLQHLRRYSRYLSPVSGVLSADSWALLAIYVRNLSLNWLSFVPVMLAVLMLPRLLVSVLSLKPPAILAQAQWTIRLPLPFVDDPTVRPELLGTIGLIGTVWAFVYAGRFQPSGRDRFAAKDFVRWPRRQQPGGQSHFLRWCLLPLVLSACALLVCWNWHPTAAADFPLMVFFGFLIGLAAWTAHAFQADDLRKLYELPVVLVAGLTSGSALWAGARVLQSHFFVSKLPGHREAWVACVAVPMALTALTCGGTVYLGLTSRLRSTWDVDREWWARFGAWVLIVSAGWLVSSFLVLIGPAELLTVIDAKTFISLGTLTGIVSLGLGHSSRTPASASGPATRPTDPTRAKLIHLALVVATPLFIAFLIEVASMLTSLLIGHFWLDIPLSNRGHYRILHHSSLGCIFWWTLGLGAFGGLMSLFINLNKFSLHGVYRDRLARAYLGASRACERHPDPFTGFDPADHLYMHELHPAFVRKCLPDDRKLAFESSLKKSFAAPVTGPSAECVAYLKEEFSDASIDALAGKKDLSQRQWERLVDEINTVLADHDLIEKPGFKLLSESNAAPSEATRMAWDVHFRNRRLLELALDGFPKLSDDTARLKSIRPLHLINIALNLVNNENTAWQDRKAESFTVSCLHSGSWRLGYRSSDRYGGDRGIGLGTAMTISGAAVSPNMGYQSSPALAFLMTLFNIRLGWWLGNPAACGDGAFRQPCPTLGIKTLIDEAFGLTDERHKYVYLSDGGHFEDLGIYEMVRRRCHWIVVGDAGADPECGFEDLGNAVRKIRIDMGVSITFPRGIKVAPRDGPDKDLGRYCAIATIDYSSIDGKDAPDGYLLYIKPAFYGLTEPADVYSYAKGSVAFPHQPTSDQFFSESQFESYRALGIHVTEKVAPVAGQDGTLRKLFWAAWDYLGKADQNPFDPPPKPDQEIK